MIFNLWDINKKLVWAERKFIEGTLAYSSGIIINLITDAKSIYEFTNVCFSFEKPAILITWILIATTIAIAITTRFLRYINKNQSPSAEFYKIMMNHTDSVLNNIGLNELSWGFNKNIHRSKEPAGWLPDAFYISDYEDNIEYQFPTRNGELPDYDKSHYDLFAQSEAMQKCIRKKNNRERFSVSLIEPNYNSKDRKVEIKLIKTNWISLQFSWNYFRRLDFSNQVINNNHLDKISEKMRKAFLDYTQDRDFAINSFCLHLIIETKDGKAVLAKISRNKHNDYPATWAATLGEQLEKDDFYDPYTNTTRNDFIQRWVRRALLEEFDISDKPKYEHESEYNEIVNEKSLRVLSIDLEGDIYNIAITCVVKLKLTFDEFKNNKGIWADSEESTELRSCDLSEIRDILLNYPQNSNMYHPSTYLRLLMFHLYKSGTSELCKSISRDYNNIKKT
ncbi:MAG: hypothetical protein J6W24_02690 [Prevotella sp.]|nr:hypothetical protein [Prevotella sp.]